jgi:hypothetical protein
MEEFGGVVDSDAGPGTGFRCALGVKLTLGTSLYSGESGLGSGTGWLVRSLAPGCGGLTAR